MKNILAISGSTRKNSSSFSVIRNFGLLSGEIFSVTLFQGIETLPHFNPDLDTENPPKAVAAFRELIARADAVLFCTPEYVFSIPGSLKNAIEWCVSGTVFSGKPTGIITAAASGEKAHESLQLILKTLECRFTQGTTLLIPGVRGKISEDGTIDPLTLDKLKAFISALDENIGNGK